jgi:hypothetical protein
MPGGDVSEGRAPVIQDLSRDDLLESARDHMISGEVGAATFAMLVLIERALRRVARGMERAYELDEPDEN